MQHARTSVSSRATGLGTFQLTISVTAAMPTESLGRGFINQARGVKRAALNISYTYIDLPAILTFSSPSVSVFSITFTFTC